jgi:pimeloyl-ACP methyl ester carboxylesterase
MAQSINLKGGGDKIVFLHGWRNTCENMRPIASELSDFDRYLIDLPGFGKSEITSDLEKFSDYAKHIADAIPERSWIIGHSFGGKLAIEIAAKYPDKVHGIVLIASAGYVKPKTLIRRHVFKNLLRIAKLFGLRKWLAGKLNAPDYAAVDLSLRRVMASGLKHDTPDTARHVKVPALIIYGEKDTQTPAWYGKKFARVIKKSKLFILPGYTHGSILTTGRFQVSGLIKDFIK